MPYFFVNIFDLVIADIQLVETAKLAYPVREAGQAVIGQAEFFQLSEMIKVSRQLGQAVIGQIQLSQPSHLTEGSLFNPANLVAAGIKDLQFAVLVEEALRQAVNLIPRNGYFFQFRVIGKEIGCQLCQFISFHPHGVQIFIFSKGVLGQGSELISA